MIGGLNNGTRSGSGGLTPMERKLLAQFNMMDEVSKECLIHMAQGIASESPRQRPKLRVIGGRAA
jgi:hypothetical protein